MYLDIEKIKREVSMAQILDYYGIELKKKCVLSASVHKALKKKISRELASPRPENIPRLADLK